MSQTLRSIKTYDNNQEKSRFILNIESQDNFVSNIHMNNFIDIKILEL